MQRKKLKNLIKGTPYIGAILSSIRKKLSGATNEFSRSDKYWNDRYKLGGNSGDGSYGNLAAFKAEILNDFVHQNNVRSIIEYGSGDGNQLSLAKYPAYTGFDVSPEAISLCNAKFRHDNSKNFRLLDQYSGETAELTLSLDVLYHLVEDQVFTDYMHRLFDSSTRYVMIYSSNEADEDNVLPAHVRHRNFSRWVEQHKPQWQLIQYIPNRYPFNGDGKVSSHSDFYIYEHK